MQRDKNERETDRQREWRGVDVEINKEERQTEKET